MKKYLLIFLVFFSGVISAQIDTTSIFIKNLPSVVKTDSNFVLISESPFTTFKTTWENLQRSFNFRQLKQTQKAYMNDILAITHKNTFDTTKGIKVSDFYKTALKDSVKGELGIAMTSIISEIESSDSALTAQLALKASIESVDSVKQRLSSAESSIIEKAGIVRLNEVRDSLFSEINLKANTTKVDSLTGRLSSAETAISLKASTTDLSEAVQQLQSEINLKASVSALNETNGNVNTAFAQITAEASARTGADSALSASIALKVGANDVYSLLQVLPSGVKIQSQNIVLEGAVVASSLESQTIEGATILGGMFSTVQSDGDRISFTIAERILSWSKFSGATASIFMDSGGMLQINGSHGVAINGLYMASENFVSNAVSNVTWSTLPGKPSTFTPSTHSHSEYLTAVPSEYITESELSSFNYTTINAVENWFHNSIDGADKDWVNNQGFLKSFTETDPTISAWAKATTKPSYAYSEITNTPNLSVYSLTTHNHDNLYTTPGWVASNFSNLGHTHEYLSSVPSEYITETELSAFGYTTINAVENWFHNSIDGADKDWVNAQGFLKAVPSEFRWTQSQIENLINNLIAQHFVDYH